MAEGEVPRRFGAYVRGRELGRGASGTVFACTATPSSPSTAGAAPAPAWSGPLAAKAIDLRRLRLSAKAERELKKLQREVDILRRVPPHPNLVRFVDALEEGSWFFLVLEYVGGGDLFSALVKRPPRTKGRRPCFSEVETVFVLRQLVAGLQVLHEHGVIHRDLKLENILVARESRTGPNIMCDVKITDFGLSKVVGEGLSMAHSTVGSPRYIAPEVLAQGVHDFRADLWSLGVLLYVLLAGRFPVDGPPPRAQPVVEGLVARTEASSEARAVVGGLLQIEREKRLSLEEVRLHDWLKPTPGNGVLRASPQKRPSSEAFIGASTVSLFGSEDCQEALAPSQQKARRREAAAGEGADSAAGEVPAEVADSEVIMIVDAAEDTAPAAVAAAPPPVPAAGPRLVPARRPRLPPPAPAPPPAPDEVPSIKDLDCQGGGKAVRGVVVFRRDHNAGGGFHLRLKDESGEIDLRFWDGAALKFKADPALSRGASLRFEGFRVVALKPKDLPFAPTGRLHSLAYNAPEVVRFIVEEPRDGSGGGAGSGGEGCGVGGAEG